MQETLLNGYIAPDDAILADFRWTEKLARLGYAAAMGARCPDCRNADAVAALQALPRAWPADPIERLLYEDQHYGIARPLPAGGGWGAAYAAALRRRNRRFDTFMYLGGGWTNGPRPEIDGVPVWKFVEREAGQVSGMARSPDSARLLLILNAEGRSPVSHDRLVQNGLLRRRRWESQRTWEPATPPPRFRGKPGPPVSVNMVIHSLTGVQPLTDFALPAAGDRRWIGLPPADLYAWMRDQRRAP